MGLRVLLIRCAPALHLLPVLSNCRALRQNRKDSPAYHWPDQGVPVRKTTQKKPRERSASKPTCPWLKLPSTGSSLNVEDFLTFRVTRLANAMRTNLTKPYLAEFELSLPEWRL